MGNPNNDWFFDQWEKNFDRKAKRITGGIIAVWLFCALAGLAFWGVVIWAIVKLVNANA